MPRASIATQRGSWEIGLDVGAELTSREFQSTDINGYPVSVEVREKIVDVPQGAFRAGYFFTDALSLESSLGLSWIMENPGTNVTDWQTQVGLGATYAIAPSSWVSPFLSSGMSARYSSQTLSASALVLGIPIEGGVRIRVGEGHSIRIQSGVIASFHPNYFGETSGVDWTVPVRVGWSLNTKAAPGGMQQ